MTAMKMQSALTISGVLLLHAPAKWVTLEMECCVLVRCVLRLHVCTLNA